MPGPIDIVWVVELDERVVAVGERDSHENLLAVDVAPHCLGKCVHAAAGRCVSLVGRNWGYFHAGMLLILGCVEYEVLVLIERCQ